MLRNVTSNDRKEIYKIIKDEFDYDYKSDNPFTKWIIYEIDNKIVGFINFNYIYDEIELIYIYVDEKYRRKGIASILMNEMIKLNNKKIILEVRESNLKAISLYEKFNFKKLYIRKKYYGNEDAIIMSRSWW